MADNDFSEFPPGMDPHLMAQLQYFSQRTGTENYGKRRGHRNLDGHCLLTLVSTLGSHLEELYTSLYNSK